MFQGLPRWLIAFGIVVIAVIEITGRLPDIMLLPQKLAGGAGEYNAKALLPQLNEAQIAKTQADARAADAQAQLTTLQQAKVVADTKIAQLQQQVTQLQGNLFASQAMLAQSQAKLADTQAAKTAAEIQVVQLQRNLTTAQTDQAQAQASQSRAQATKTTLENVGTVATFAAAIGGGLYLADKAGLIPHNEGTTQASQTYSAPVAPSRKAIITSAGANVRSCGGAKCDIVNRGDPIIKGTEVVITGAAVVDDGQNQWLPVSARTSTATYAGFMSGSILSVE